MINNVNDIIKLAVAIAVIIVVVIYPVLNIDIPTEIVSGFGALVTYVLGLSTKGILGNGSNNNTD